MVQRFIPNIANQEITKSDARKCRSPPPADIALSKDDRSKTKEELEQLENEFGFRFIELLGCYNWLSYTCHKELCAICKLCCFMSMPGRLHFQAALHLLHHFCCHPPKPLIFFHNRRESPAHRMLSSIEAFTKYFEDADVIVFADSSHGDSDEG